MCGPFVVLEKNFVPALDTACKVVFAEPMTNTAQLTITLASGETHSFPVAKMPRHWKSWTMQQMPYGTIFTGCTFSRKAL